MRLYIPEDVQRLLQRELRLAPAMDGKIELCRTFSEDLSQPFGEHGVLIAHPLIVYAELMSGDDVRLGETAVRMRVENLAWIA